MSKVKFHLYGSTIAALLGRNAYESPAGAFEKLLKKIDARKYDFVSEHCVTEKARRIAVKEKYKEIVRVCDNARWRSNTVQDVEKNKEAVRAQVNSLAENVKNAHEQAKKELENIQRELCELDAAFASIREEILSTCAVSLKKKVLQCDTMEGLLDLVRKSRSVSAETKVSLADNVEFIKEKTNEKDALSAKVESSAKEVAIAEEDKLLLREVCDSMLNTTFGIKYENRSLQKFVDEYKLPVDTPKGVTKKLLFENDVVEVCMCGKVDGVIWDDLVNGKPAVVEIKNRVRNIFKELVGYEKVQIHTYMYMLSMDQCFLIQSLKGSDDTMVVDMYEWDSGFFQDLRTDIERYCNAFVAGVHDEGFLMDYSACVTEEEKTACLVNYGFLLSA